MDSQPACPDGLTDDYEYWHGELPELDKDKKGLCVPVLQDI